MTDDELVERMAEALCKTTSASDDKVHDVVRRAIARRYAEEVLADYRQRSGRKTAGFEMSRARGALRAVRDALERQGRNQ